MIYFLYNSILHALIYHKIKENCIRMIKIEKIAFTVTSVNKNK